MKKKIYGIAGMLLALIVCFGMSAPAAYAADAAGLSPFQVEVTLEGTLPDEAEDFQFLLQAVDAGAPMPEGSVDGTYTMTVSGAGTAAAPVIAYSKLGVYHYQITQQAGESADCTYDDTVYSLTVYVTNAEEGDGIDVTAVLFTASESEKLDSASFQNIYPTVVVSETPADPTTVTTSTVKTGDAAAPMIALLILAAAVCVLAGMGICGAKKKNRA